MSEEVKSYYGRRSDVINLYGRCFAFGNRRGQDQASLPKLLVRKCRFAYSSPNHLYRSRVVAAWLHLEQPHDKD